MEGLRVSRLPTQLPPPEPQDASNAGSPAEIERNGAAIELGFPCMLTLIPPPKPPAPPDSETMATTAAEAAKVLSEMKIAEPVSSSRYAKGGKEGWAAAMASHKSGENFDLLGQAHMCVQRHWGSVKENKQVIELLGQAQTSMTLFKVHGAASCKEKRGQLQIDDLLDLSRKFSCLCSLEGDIPDSLGGSVTNIQDSFPSNSQLIGMCATQILETRKHVVDSLHLPRFPEWTADEPRSNHSTHTMWQYLLTNRVADEEKFEETFVCYVMDALGSTLQDTHEPNVRVAPLLFMPTGTLASTMSIAILWSTQNVQQGKGCTRDFYVGIGQNKPLFYPRAQHVSGAINIGQAYIPIFSSQLGVYIEGSVSPPLAGVHSRLFSAGESNITTLNSGELVPGNW